MKRYLLSVFSVVEFVAFSAAYFALPPIGTRRAPHEIEQSSSTRRWNFKLYEADCTTALCMTSYNVRKSKHVHRHDEWYMAALDARTCARSSTSSAEDAEEHLNKLLGMQAGCIAGTVDPKSDVCADPLWVAEIVDELRNKLGYSGPVEGYENVQSHESKSHVQENRLEP